MASYHGFEEAELIKAHLIVEEFRFRRELAGLGESRQVEVYEASLTKKQAASALGVSQRTIDREIKAGRLLASGVGTQVRVDRDELDRFKQLQTKRKR